MFGLLGFIGTKTHCGGKKMRESFYLEGSTCHILKEDYGVYEAAVLYS